MQFPSSSRWRRRSDELYRRRMSEKMRFEGPTLTVESGARSIEFYNASFAQGKRGKNQTKP